jgi:hypothetical protein
VATCQVNYANPGAHSISAAYSGDTAYAGSGSASLIGTVNLPATQATTTSVSASPNPATTGHPVTYTATVGPTDNGGSVAFYDNGAPIGSCAAQTLSAGVATCQVSYANPGAHSISAAYSGDTGYGGSGSSSLIETVNLPTHGYWLIGSDGGVFTFGSTQYLGSTGGISLQRPIVGMSVTADRGGYWLVASDGGIFTFGDAPYYGSIPGLGLNPAGSGKPNSLNAPIVGMVPSPDGKGYFLVASDGGVFAFGDAKFEGSCPSIGGCSGSVVAVVPDATDLGYWVITATGSVDNFGDAPNYGEPGQQSSAITAGAATPDGKGYWVLDANGQVFSYGDAAGLGSVPTDQAGGLEPAVAIIPTADGGGYWVVNALSKVFSFGDAPNDGDVSHIHLDGSIIAGAGF